jgi:DNA-directed RNA polymerase specialized sigma24 family protein
MDTVNLDVRLDVIGSLQRKLLKSRPGSLAEEVSEYALTLALSLRRTAANPKHLERSVRRDSFRILTRHYNRFPRTSLDEGCRDLEDGASNPNEPREASTPEEQALGEELKARIRGALEPQDALCFDDLLRGASVEEISEHLDVSPRTIKRCIQRVRTTVAALILEEV